MLALLRNEGVLFLLLLLANCNLAEDEQLNLHPENQQPIVQGQEPYLNPEVVDQEQHEQGKDPMIKVEENAHEEVFHQEEKDLYLEPDSEVEIQSAYQIEQDSQGEERDFHVGEQDPSKMQNDPHEMENDPREGEVRDDIDNVARNEYVDGSNLKENSNNDVNGGEHIASTDNTDVDNNSEDSTIKAPPNVHEDSNANKEDESSETREKTLEIADDRYLWTRTADDYVGGADDNSTDDYLGGADGVVADEDNSAIEEENIAANNSADDNPVGSGTDVDNNDGLQHGYPKKKVPLREILLRLKPASLMDEDEKAQQQEDLHESPKMLPKRSSGVYVNESLVSLTSNKSSSNNRRAVCTVMDTADNVQLLNATGLQALVSPNLNTSTRSTPAPCQLMFFFSPHCQFSVAAAPHIHAMAAGLRGVMPVYGIDSVRFHSINSQYGIMGTPTLLLFHNGHSVAQYNASSYSASLLTSFIKHYTDYSFQGVFNASSEGDLQESLLPLEVTPRSVLWLAASWLFLISVSCYGFLRSSVFGRIMEAVLNNWREAEAHQHQD